MTKLPLLCLQSFDYSSLRQELLHSAHSRGAWSLFGVFIVFCGSHELPSVGFDRKRTKTLVPSQGAFAAPGLLTIPPSAGNVYILSQRDSSGVSFATVHWIDVFVREQYFDMILQSLKHRQFLQQHNKPIERCTAEVIFSTRINAVC